MVRVTGFGPPISRRVLWKARLCRVGGIHGTNLWNQIKNFNK